MDSNGVPQKINRHVFKAVTHYSLKRKEGTRFSEVLEYVRLCNRNLKPVANLKASVRKALENFQRFGLIQKDRNSRYKIIKLPIFNEDLNSSPPAKKKTHEPRDDGLQRRRDIGPNSRKRTLSSDSIENEDVETTRKRFKSQKNLKNRDGKRVNLPKSRRPVMDSFAFESDVPNFQNSELPMETNYEDDSMLREPGADDRDSGDNLRVKSRTTFSAENTQNSQQIIGEETEKDDSTPPPKPELDEPPQKDINENNNVENPETSTSFPKNSLSFCPYLN